MAKNSSDGLALDDQLCFALYRSSQAVMASYRKHLADAGLTYTQYLVLLVLWEDEMATMGSLSGKMGLDSGTLTPLVKRLESKGLVTRNRDPQDERVVKLGLTPDAISLRKEVKKARQKVVKDTGMTLEQIAQLRKELHTLAARVEDMTAK